MRRLWAFLFVAILILSCAFGREFDTHPYVVIDTSFPEEAQAGILAGLEAWHRAVPAIQFEVHYATHEAILRQPDLYDDTVTIFRVDGIHDYCPFSFKGELGEGVAANESTHLDQAGICIDANYLTSHIPLWKQITMHEVGHMLRLQHDAYPSIMCIPYDCGIDLAGPSARDAMLVRAFWHIGTW